MFWTDWQKELSDTMSYSMNPPRASFLAPGEEELYRAELKKKITLVVTNRRLIQFGTAMSQTPLSRIGSLKARSNFDLFSGRYYYISIYLVGSQFPSQWGDVYLECRNKQQQDDVLTAIQNAMLRYSG